MVEQTEALAPVIVITPAMIEAGVEALVNWEDSENPSCAEAVGNICRAMLAKSLQCRPQS